MLTEDYCSYEIAKLLKEKGFDEKCQKVYMYNSQLLLAQTFMEGESFVDNKCIELVANYNNWITYIQGEYAYLCPTHQMAMKWLRNVHKLHIEISVDVNDKHCFYASIYYNGEECWEEKEYYPDGVTTYEEAVEAALKYSLENLI